MATAAASFTAFAAGAAFSLAALMAGAVFSLTVLTTGSVFSFTAFLTGSALAVIAFVTSSAFALALRTTGLIPPESFDDSTSTGLSERQVKGACLTDNLPTSNARAVSDETSTNSTLHFADDNSLNIDKEILSLPLK